MTSRNFHLLHLPSREEQTICLIREELKSRRLFLTLHKIGLDECAYQPHLDDLILRHLGLDDSDETFGRYTAILDKRCKKIDTDRDSITRQALKTYWELLSIKELNRKIDL